jgi:protocatechuate 3,4-dioxygenase beta subunit
MLGLLGGVGGVGLLTLAGCGGADRPGAAARTPGSAPPGPATTATTGTTATTTAISAADCAPFPTETGGPFPADGTNGPNVLNQAGVVRTDLRESFVGLRGTATGSPLAVRLRVLDLDAGCTPRRGIAVYAWHCDGDGRYSLYSAGATDQNWCRGVQVTDGDGTVAFTTVFPGAYPGRYPHLHFEVYASAASAAAGGPKLLTSQLAFPEAACTAVYAQPGYEASQRNFPQTPIARDNVFRDGVGQQMATVTGTAPGGLTAALTLAVRAGAV